MTTLWLAPSDVSLDKGVCLTNPDGASAGNGIMAVRSGFHAPAPAMKIDGSSGSTYGIDDGSGYENRQIEIDLFIQGATAVQLHELRRSIINLLTMARRSTGAAYGAWVGSPVVLIAGELDTPNLVQFDILHGDLVEIARDYGPASVQMWRLDLVALPLARGAPIPDPESATLTNGLSGYITRLAVPGDVRALCQLTLTDYSDTNGSRVPVLQGGRVAVRSLRWGTPYTPVVATVATGGASSAPDAGGKAPINGASTPQITTTNLWAPMCIATVTGTHGLLDLYAHFRDASTAIVGPTNLAAAVDYSAGSLGAKTTYTVVVTSLDGSGNETTASLPVSFTLADTAGRAFLTWTINGSSVVSHRVYFSVGGAPWQWLPWASATGAFTFTTVAGATTASPPSVTDPTILPAQVRLRVGLNVASPVWSRPGDPITPQLLGNQWEYGYGGTFICPPMGRQEGQADQGFKVLVEVRSQGTSTPAFDCDGIWFLPHDEPQCIFEYAGLANASASRYVLDTRRDGRVTCLVTDQGGMPTATGHLTPRGQFTLGPGDNTIIFMLEDTGGVADVKHLKFRAQLTIRPRYLDVIGLVT